MRSPLRTVLSNKPMKDFQAVPYQAKAVNPGNWGVQNYIFSRLDSFFNGGTCMRAAFDHSALSAASGAPSSCKSKSIARIYGRTGSRMRPSQSLISIQTGCQLLRPTPQPSSQFDIYSSHLFTGASRFWQLAFPPRRYHLRTCMRRALCSHNPWFH